MGYHLAALLLLFFVLNQVASICSNIWLSVWTEDKLLKNLTLANTTDYLDTQYFYMGIYGGLGAAQGEWVSGLGG